MRGFNPKGARRAKKFANGGMVRGPGTGTSDDIETEVPEGSYIMPADTTATLGPQALAGMGGARGFPARGNPVPVNLSNGEYKMPPEQVHAVGVQALDQIKNATHTPSATEAARGFQPVEPGEPRMFFEGGGLVTRDELEKARQQAVAARPSYFTQQSGYMKDQQQAAQQNYDQLSARYQKGQGTVAGGVDWRGPSTAQIAQAARGLPQPSVTSAPAAAPVEARQPTATTAAPSVAPNPTDQRLTAGTQRTPGASEPAAQPAATPAAPAREDGKIYFDPKTNTYGGSNVGFNPEFVGSRNGGGNLSVLPGAGMALSAMASGVGGRMVGGLPMQTSLGEFNSLDNAIRAANLRDGVDINRGVGGNGPTMQVIGGAPMGFRRDANIVVSDMRTQAALDRATGRDPASLRRAAEQQRVQAEQEAAMARNTQDNAVKMADIQARGFDAQTARALDARRLGLEEQVKGIDIRAAQRLESLQTRYAEAKTDADRAKIAREIRDLSGKTAADRMQTVTTKAQYDALPKGAQYIRNGITYTKE